MTTAGEGARATRERQRSVVAGSAGRRACFGYTPPYFQYDKSGGVKWTFAGKSILFVLSALRGIEFISGFDKNWDGHRAHVSQRRRDMGHPASS